MVVVLILTSNCTPAILLVEEWKFFFLPHFIIANLWLIMRSNIKHNFDAQPVTNVFH